MTAETASKRINTIRKTIAKHEKEIAKYTAEKAEAQYGWQIEDCDRWIAYYKRIIKGYEEKIAEFEKVIDGQATSIKRTDVSVNQVAIFKMVKETIYDMIGGLENDVMDNDLESSKQFLSMGHENMVEYFFNMIRVQREAQKHLKFAGNDFLRQTIEKRLEKIGY